MYEMAIASEPKPNTTSSNLRSIDLGNQYDATASEYQDDETKEFSYVSQDDRSIMRLPVLFEQERHRYATERESSSDHHRLQRMRIRKKQQVAADRTND